MTTPQWTIGLASETGAKDRNEDAIKVVTPEGGSLSSKGALCVLADGVSSCADGKLAAASSVQAVSSDYYATPETWEVSTALERVLTAQNRWLGAQGQPLLTTLSALVLRGQRFTIAHIGDCRVYRYASLKLKALTQEHVWEEPTMRHVLKRALGLDQHLIVDFIEGDIEEKDLFVLVCDGVWGALNDAHIERILAAHSEQPQKAAEVLVNEAISCGSQDNVSAIVVRIEHLPPANLGDELSRGQFLPLPPKLKINQGFEGFMVENILGDSPSNLTYKVRDALGHPWVLKTLQPTMDKDIPAQQALLTEEWLQKRLTTQYFPEVKLTSQRHSLYYVIRWYEGKNLKEWAENQEVTFDQLITFSLRTVRAISALHRLNILHRDIKPENIHFGADQRLRVLDLGVAYCAGLTPETALTPGTPSFMAPELFEGQPASVQSDLYAIGVTLYWLVTRHFPYGEVEAFQRPQFGQLILPSRYRPDLPMWFENILIKALEKDPKRRFETAEEFQKALEQGESRPISVRRHVPWAERSPLRVWQSMSLISFILNIALIYFILLR